jgi:hypothetical protein
MHSQFQVSSDTFHQCKHCGLQKHPSCNEWLLECASVARGTPEQKRRWYNWTSRKALILFWKRIVPQLPKDIIRKIDSLLK